MNVLVKKLIQAVVNKYTSRKAIKQNNTDWFLARMSRMAIVWQSKITPDMSLCTTDPANARSRKIQEAILDSNAKLGHPLQVTGDIQSLTLLDWANMECELVRQQFHARSNGAKMPEFTRLRTHIPRNSSVIATVCNSLPRLWHAVVNPLTFVLTMLFVIAASGSIVRDLITLHTISGYTIGLSFFVQIILAINLFSYKLPERIMSELECSVSQSWTDVFDLTTETDAMLVAMLSGMYQYEDENEGEFDCSQYTPQQVFYILDNTMSIARTGIFSFGENFFGERAASRLSKAISAANSDQHVDQAFMEKARQSLQRESYAPESNDYVDDTRTPPDHMNAYANDPQRSKFE